jgi:hypothetical protein
VSITAPHLTGQSFLALPTLTNAYSDLQLSIEFKPEAPNGILLLGSISQNYVSAENFSDKFCSQIGDIFNTKKKYICTFILGIMYVQ